jgi:hypothetical protein
MRNKVSLMAALFVIFTLLIPLSAYPQGDLLPAVTTPIKISELAEYASSPPAVKTMIKKAEILSRLNLTYQYSSADPHNKGMDCSGTIYYLLTTNYKLKNVPRSSDEIFNWVKQNGKLHNVSSNSLNSIDFSQLKPGDLLFWSGTYQTTSHISHVMLYLGKNKQGKRLMFGSSDGRTYQGKKMWGVSLYDFVLPNKNKQARFIGYSCIPEITC